ncbi:MAG: SufB/SufD family protein [Oscillospiraceae bacterium]|jgi:Fe-S cluster assembly scaffold protein SufB
MAVRINRLAEYTFDWLGMNGADIDPPALRAGLSLKSSLPDGFTEGSGDSPRFQDIGTGGGKTAEELIDSSHASAYEVEVPEGISASVPAKLIYDLGNSPAGDTAKAEISVGRGSSACVIMSYLSDPAASGFGAVQTKVSLAEGASLTLVQTEEFSRGVSFINDLGAELGEGASLNLIRLTLGGKKVCDGCRVLLSGRKSSFSADIGYSLSGDSDLDINCESVHTGKKTKCSIEASGVLKDSASKIFRGTIDFRKGCSGSVGDEVENVLLMNEAVHNKTIPVILCSEEDVVGNHGATIGRLDEQAVYYMESRGMTKEQIYTMIARARIDSIIKKICDEETRNRLFSLKTF